MPGRRASVDLRQNDVTGDICVRQQRSANAGDVGAVVNVLHGHIVDDRRNRDLRRCLSALRHLRLHPVNGLAVFVRLGAVGDRRLVTLDLSGIIYSMLIGAILSAVLHAAMNLDGTNLLYPTKGVNIRAIVCDCHRLGGPWRLSISRGDVVPIVHCRLAADRVDILPA